MFFRRNKPRTEENTPASPSDGAPRATSADASVAYDVIGSVLTDVGCHREVNEDYIRLVQPADEERTRQRGVLALVADGMGGHAAGEVASHLAGEVITRTFYESKKPAALALHAAFMAANRHIYEAASKDERLQGMGTTCTALLLQNGTALCAHVGDSRLYLIRDGHIYVMSEDHSLVMEMVKQGLLSQEEARQHDDKNVILRALGLHPQVEVALWEQPFAVRLEDRFLLCSDGLSDLVKDEEILLLADEGEPEAACAQLVALARERGGYDNISVGLLRLAPPGAAEQQAAPEDLRATREAAEEAQSAQAADRRPPSGEIFKDE